MEEEKIVETVPVEEETTPVEESTPVEETAPVEESTDNGEGEIKALLSEVLTEVKGLVALITDEPKIVPPIEEEDGSNDTNVDELESQLDDLDF